MIADFMLLQHDCWRCPLFEPDCACFTRRYPRASEANERYRREHPPTPSGASEGKEHQLRSKGPSSDRYEGEGAAESERSDRRRS